MSKRAINEKFGILPIGLTKIDDVEGMDLYSSDNLKQQYVDALSHQRMLHSVSNEVSGLVNSGVIVPCFVSSGIIKWFMHRAFANEIDKAAMGLYYPTTNKIYILMDNRIKMFIWTSNKKLSTVTIHELMHYFSQNYHDKFVAIFDQMLSQYYSNFFNLCYGKKIFSDELGRRFYKYLLNTCEWSKAEEDNGQIYETAEFLDQEMSAYLVNKEERNDLIVSILSPLKIFLNNSSSFISLMNSNPELRSTIEKLYRSYRIFGLKQPDTTPIQELIYPSEVIAILSEKPTAKHYLALHLMR